MGRLLGGPERLVARGSPLLVISDEAAGLVGPIERAFPRTLGHLGGRG